MAHELCIYRALYQQVWSWKATAEKHSKQGKRMLHAFCPSCTIDLHPPQHFSTVNSRVNVRSAASFCTWSRPFSWDQNSFGLRPSAKNCSHGWMHACVFVACLMYNTTSSSPFSNMSSSPWHTPKYPRIPNIPSFSISKVLKYICLNKNDAFKSVRMLLHLYTLNCQVFVGSLSFCFAIIV